MKLLNIKVYYKKLFKEFESQIIDIANINENVIVATKENIIYIIDYKLETTIK